MTQTRTYSRTTVEETGDHVVVTKHHDNRPATTHVFDTKQLAAEYERLKHSIRDTLSKPSTAAATLTAPDIRDHAAPTHLTKGDLTMDTIQISKAEHEAVVDATAVVQKNATPSYTSDCYEDAMVNISKRYAAAKGISVGEAQREVEKTDEYRALAHCAWHAKAPAPVYKAARDREPVKKDWTADEYYRYLASNPAQTGRAS
jgi:hypothetical protein